MRTGKTLPLPLMACLLMAVSARGAIDGGSLRWQFLDSDCGAVIQLHDSESSANESQIERIRLRAGTGTYCFFEFDIADCHLIEDFTARVSVQSNREGIGVLAKVRFPRVIDPQTNEAVSVYLPCDTYSRPGAWQDLRVERLTDQLPSQVRYLRRKFGRTIDTSDPRIDSLVINAFGGPGTTEVFVGDVSIAGQVPIEAISAGTNRSNGITAERSRSTCSVPASLRNGILRIGEQYFLPLIVDYHGEPFSVLAELGINTIALNQLPSSQMLDDAKRFGLWFICPPPPPEIMATTRSLERVLFWNVGPIDDRSQRTERAISPLRREDPCGRLLVTTAAVSPPDGARDPFEYHSPLVDIQAHRFMDNQASLIAEYDRLAKRTEYAPRGTVWARIPTNQERFYAAGTEVVLAAIGGGANAIWYESNRPLTTADAETALRRSMIQATNYRLEAIRPWVVGAEERHLVLRSMRPEARVVQLRAHDADLLLLVFEPETEFSQPIVITTPGTTESSDVFQVLPTGLRPLKRKRVTGGFAIRIEDVDSTCPLLVTENRMATNQLARFASATRRRAVSIQRALAHATIRYAEAKNAPSANVARQVFGRGQDLLDSGDSTNAYHAFQDVRRTLRR